MAGSLSIVICFYTFLVWLHHNIGIAVIKFLTSCNGDRNRRFGDWLSTEHNADCVNTGNFRGIFYTIRAVRLTLDLWFHCIGISRRIIDHNINRTISSIWKNKSKVVVFKKTLKSGLGVIAHIYKIKNSVRS